RGLRPALHARGARPRRDRLAGASRRSRRAGGESGPVARGPRAGHVPRAQRARARPGLLVARARTRAGRCAGGGALSAAALETPVGSAAEASRPSVPRALILALVLTLPLVTPKIRGADEIEYFSYLHSAVFDHDLEFGDEYEHFYAADPRGL